jgi:mRNA-degrading endonuclease RelE of RelBE toxin-antitoxin system
MTPAQRFRLFFMPVTRQHLQHIDRKWHMLIREKCHEQLTYDALVETRNRKPLRRPILDAAWKIRFGPDNQFRVFYRVDQSRGEIYIVAIGEKKGNRLYVGGEEIYS